MSFADEVHDGLHDELVVARAKDLGWVPFVGAPLEATRVAWEQIREADTALERAQAHLDAAKELAEKTKPLLAELARTHPAEKRRPRAGCSTCGRLTVDCVCVACGKDEENCSCPPLPSALAEVAR